MKANHLERWLFSRLVNWSCWGVLILIHLAVAQAADKNPTRGEPIRKLRPAGSNTVAVATNALPLTTATNAQRQGPFVLTTNATGYVTVPFSWLADYPYEITNVYSEEISGRALTKPLTKIPDNVKALDNLSAEITGFVFPLRIKNNLVTEFLLVRDLASCCFGGVPAVNHWVRVKMKGPGVDIGPEPHAVRGRLRVGEKYEQEYLTGIYEMEAESATPVSEP